MNRQIFEEIYNSISQEAIAHIKTNTGDKLCFKDNKNSAKTGINCIIHDLYVEISNISIAEKSKKQQVTAIPYSNILLVEFTSNTKEDEASKQKGDD